jgi:hypothetical protein
MYNNISFLNISSLIHVAPLGNLKSEFVEVYIIDAEPFQNVADLKVTCSPGVTTRSLSFVFPNSPNPTMRMTSISPRGINSLEITTVLP